MANLEDICRQVRLAVHDPNPPPSFRPTIIYSDSVYEDAVRFALNKLNLDLRNLTDFTPSPPWTLFSLPDTMSFLLIKLATIQLAQIRGAEGANNIMVAPSISAISSIEVPDLKVGGGASDPTSVGAAYWKSLWDRLQKEYDGELSRLVSKVALSFGTIIQMDVPVLSCRTNSLQHNLDRGLPATTLDISYSGGVLTYDWEPVYASAFNYYLICYKKSTASEIEFAYVYDNSTVTYSAAVALNGLYTFYMYTVNNNNIKTKSNVVTLKI